MRENVITYTKVAHDEAEETFSCSHYTLNLFFNNRTLDVDRFVKAMILLAIALAGCGASYLFCPVCSLGVVVFCFVLCCFEPILNIPLWIAFLLLLFFGWTWTPNKHLIIDWH